MVSRIVTDFGIWITEKARQKFKDENQLRPDYGKRVAYYVAQLIEDRLYERGIKSEWPIRIMFDANENAVRPKDFYSALLLYGYYVPEAQNEKLSVYTPDQKTRIWIESSSMKTEYFKLPTVPKESNFIILDKSRELLSLENPLKTEYKLALTGLIESD